MQCFSWTPKFRKCAICNEKVNDYIRYNLRNIDPEGIVSKSALLDIMLKDIKIAKRNRVLCQECYTNIQNLCAFKSRVRFVHNTLIPEGLLIRSMCSVCYEYNPTYMSGIFDNVISSNQSLITYTFEINFSNIVNNRKLTCEDCMRYLCTFCKMHINFQRAHPRMHSMVVDVTRSSSSIGRRLSSLLPWCSNATSDEAETEEPKDQVNERYPKSEPSGSLRRIPNIPKNLDCLETLYQRDSFAESDSMFNTYFNDSMDYRVGDRRMHFEDRGTPEQLSETSNYFSSLDIPVGSSDATQQQKPSTSAATKTDKLKRLFSKKSKDENPELNADKDEKSKKSTKGKKRKGKAEKIAESCE